MIGVATVVADSASATWTAAGVVRVVSTYRRLVLRRGGIEELLNSRDGVLLVGELLQTGEERILFH